MKTLSISDVVLSTGAKGYGVARPMICATVMLGLASAAMALPPDNDDQSSATGVAAIGYSETIDTTEATTEPDDPDCYGNGPTVWYSFTPDENTFIGANTFGSTYDTTLSAYVMDVDGLVRIACNDDAGDGAQSRIRFEAQVGVTYLFMVGSYASGPGGNMTFNLIEAPPQLQIELAIDSRGGVSSRTGSATLRGTVACSGQTEVYIDGNLRQRAGRFYVDGYGSTSISCNGTTPWSFDVSSYNGRFAGGRADANVWAFSYGNDDQDNSFDFKSRTVSLSGSRR